MKIIKHILFIGCLSAGIALLGACAKWTDVRPKMEIPEEIIFSTEEGYQEALNGVYGGMGSAAYYGREMTWGLIDVIGGAYDNTRVNNYEVEAATGDFNHILTQNVIKEIWNSAYNSIANGNNLLDALDQADPAIFSGRSKDLFKGEALGLRALMHFDILRLFMPAFNTAGWNQPLLPYVVDYGSNVTKWINGAEFIDRVLADLAEAEALLAEDPIRGTLDVSGLKDRKVRFNYYAVKAVQARVYTWIGDREKALQAAGVVIDAAPSRFAWTPVGSIQSSIPPSYDYILSSENVFSLYVNRLKDYTEGRLIHIPITSTFFPTFLPHYSISEQQRQEWYEAAGAGVTDYRNIYMIGGEQEVGNTTLLYKKLQQEGGYTTFGQMLPFEYAGQRIPLIKLSEMMYIAAECLSDNDPQLAVSYLNTIRTNRGISQALSPTLSGAEIRNEIRKEYQKEFPCEGQLFYYHKRNLDKNYVLPLPQWEQEYGF